MEKPWSNYKNTNIFRLLVCATPNGVTYFPSSLCGRISGKHLTIRSGLLDLTEPGDSVMADGGFDIENILVSRTSLNIPPFLSAKTHFYEDEQEKLAI